MEGRIYINIGSNIGNFTYVPIVKNFNEITGADIMEFLKRQLKPEQTDQIKINGWMIAKKFDTGPIVETRIIRELRDKDPNYNSFVFESLQRHIRCDWGELDNDDIERNNEALISEGRLFSSYESPTEKLWIITEVDRSSTTILLPSEY